MNEIIDGICCELCIKKDDSPSCPVRSASPWSRWTNFCNEFENDKHQSIRDVIILENQNDNR